ncbi:MULTISPECIES: HEAT repeat domain-containing protein [Myxococcus]|uniref:HEAT repeat domain-containing protein n=1 Tax=Myxococcus TaxID=32 RepID=UPI001F08483B|nr:MULTISPECIES: HEAT repeat domain-containing protein [Myxococcus]
MPAPIPTSTDRWRRAWVPGTQFVYTVSTEQRLSFGQPARNAPPTVRMGLTGELSLGVVGVHGDQVDLQVLVRAGSITFESEGQDSLDDKRRPEMLGHLQQPFYVTLNAQGAALVTYFELGVNPVAQNFLRSLVASTQFVMPDAPQDTWQAQELDVTGQYVADYQGSAGQPYVKSKARYLRLASPEGLRAIAASVQVATRSRTTIILGDELWPKSLEGQERLELNSNDGAPPILGEVQVSLLRTSVRRVPTLIGMLDARRKHLGKASLATQVFAPADPREELRRQVAGARLEDLAGKLRQLPREEGANGQATAQLMARLKALFQLEPASALAVPGQLRGEEDRNTYSSMLGALSAASTPEAVRALGQVASDGTLALPVRVDATAALGAAEAPTAEGIDALRALSGSTQQELRGTATLALGNATRNALAQGGAQGESLMRELMRSVATAQTPQARALQLRALANTADVRVLPTLQEALRDPSPIVREAAAEALRLIPGPDADRMVSAVMLGDMAPEVRRAAIFATSFRALAPQIPALAQVIRQDAVEAVRIEAVRLLGTNLRNAPGVAEILAWAGQNDPNSDVRHTAMAFLGTRAPVR